jgi:hypothetical protein
MGTQRGPDHAFVQGNTGHGQDDSGNPVGIGGFASSTPPTAVGEEDRVRGWFDLNGRLNVVATLVPPTVSDDTSTGLLSVTIAATNGSVGIIPAPGVGSFVFVESVFCSNADPTFSTDMSLIEDGTTRIKAHLAHRGGGFVKDFARPWKLAENVGLAAQCGTAVTAAYINVQFYTST